MKINSKIIQAIGIGILILLDISCKKFVAIDPPNTQLVTSTVFTNDATATAAVTAIYGNMYSDVSFTGYPNGNICFLAGLSSDELTNYSTNSSQIQFYTNTLDKNDGNIATYFWGKAYQYIYFANSAIQGLSNSNQLTPAIKLQLLGECKFIRSFCYFYLVNLFGEVPLVTSTDYKLNSIISRTSKGQVYQQIISDLKDAQNLLASDYSFSNGERVRPNKWAATAFLARVYLYLQDWANAEALSTSVINDSSTFHVENNLSNVFLKSSPEAIWQLMPTFNTLNTWEGFGFILSGTPSNVAMSTQLLNSFDSGDRRKTNWVDSITIGSKTYYYPYKYKVKTIPFTTPPTQLTEYSIVFRLSEQYLIRAEARAQQDNLIGAINDLNMIRARAGLSNTNAETQPDLISAILHERQVELFTEWGHRWLDLKRTGTIDAIMGTVGGVCAAKGGNWNTNQQLYPIPQSEIQNDPNLVQNPGY